MRLRSCTSNNRQKITQHIPPASPRPITLRDAYTQHTYAHGCVEHKLLDQQPNTKDKRSPARVTQHTAHTDQQSIYNNKLYCNNEMRPCVRPRPANRSRHQMMDYLFTFGEGQQRKCLCILLLVTFIFYPCTTAAAPKGSIIYHPHDNVDRPPVHTR